MSKKLFLCVAIIIFLAGFVFSASTSRAEINVYDNDGQYLGILISHDEMGIQVWLPSTGNFFYFSQKRDDPTHRYLGGTAYYETTDCSGTPYTMLWYNPGGPSPYWVKWGEVFPWVSKNCTGSSYWTPGAVSTIKTTTLKSYQSFSACECNFWSGEGQVIELIETSAPPLTLPVSLPFRYEHTILGAEKVVIGPP